MTSRERVIKTLKFDNPDRIPREIWYCPAESEVRKREYAEVERRFPGDFASPSYKYGKSEKASGDRYKVGTSIDEWGCVWSVGEFGVCGEVKEYPLSDINKLGTFKPPFEVLNDADFSNVNKSCAETDKFVRVMPQESGIFERMQWLRGTEKLMIDLAYGSKGIIKLRDIVHDFFMKEMQLWIKTDIDGFFMLDDWGSQNALLISPEMWRDIFKPVYKEYFSLLHKHNKYVFFHSDGNITSIIPDLIEIRVDALNSQLFCMKMENISHSYKGKLTFWGEMDRQKILPFGTVKDVKNAVRKVKTLFSDENGGVIAQCEWGKDVSKENIIAVFETWDEE